MKRRGLVFLALVLVGCAETRARGRGGDDSGGSWSALDTTQLCELHLTTLEFSSAPGVCDGAISGTFMGIFTNNEPLGGSFSLPLQVAESEVEPPGCQPYDGPCSSNADCCSGSCSMYIGVCN